MSIKLNHLDSNFMKYTNNRTPFDTGQEPWSSQISIFYILFFYNHHFHQSGISCVFFVGTKIQWTWILLFPSLCRASIALAAVLSRWIASRRRHFRWGRRTSAETIRKKRLFCCWHCCCWSHGWHRSGHQWLYQVNLALD